MKQETSETEIISYIEASEYVSIPRGVYMSRCHQRSGRSMHAHTCIEMTYILSGSATHEIRYPDGTILKEPITVGNYYVLDYRIHHIIRDTSPDFLLINLLFHPSFIDSGLEKNEPFDNLLKTVFRDIHLKTVIGSVANRNYFDGDRSVRQTFEKAWEIYSLREAGYRDLLRCYISEILIITTKKMIPQEFEKRHAVVEIRDYVNTHYMEDLSLRQICRDRFLNMSFISRKFKAVIGIPFESYLLNVRIQNACTMLIETDDPIDTIIEKVGYTDGDSFRKNFKRIVNTTPLRFRKLYR